MGNCLPLTTERRYHLYKTRKQNAANWPVAPTKCGLENGSTLTGCSSPILQTNSATNQLNQNASLVNNSTNSKTVLAECQLNKEADNQLPLRKLSINKPIPPKLNSATNITQSPSIQSTQTQSISTNQISLNTNSANHNTQTTSSPQMSILSNSETIVPNTKSFTDKKNLVNSHSQSLSIIPPILQNGDPMKMKAIYDYHRRTIEEISLVKGDLVLVLNNVDHEWWLVEHQGTKARGFVPTSYLAMEGSIEAEDWFVRDIGRKDAVRLLLLRNNPTGTFMVRECESAHESYSLSIRDADFEESVKHYKIRVIKSEDKADHSTNLPNPGPTVEYNITSRHVFSTLQGLIRFYSEGDHGLCCRLTIPCPRTAPLTSDLSYKTKDHWEISRDSINLIERLGGGQFGDVYKGKWNDAVLVAVKTLRPGAMTRNDFLKEARLMKDLNHPKLVKLYAVCSEDPIYIITELMSHGSLLDYLHSDAGTKLELSVLVDIISQIASGMSYLEKRHYIHRDLAARNILVGDDNVIKVADFGLARMMKDQNDTYEAKQGTKFPIKWTAPEAALMGRFTIKSDVWSFGIVVYEVITHGGVPYPTMNNTETLRQVDDGYRMPRPTSCPPQMYEVVLETWHSKPEERPTFEYLSQYFEDFFVRAAETNYKKTATLTSN